MKRFKNILSGILILIMCMMVFSGCSNNNANNIKSNTQNTNQPQSTNTSPAPTGSSTSQQVSGKDTDRDGIPDAVEKTYGTNPYTPDTDGDGQNDKVDKDPNFTENPINEPSTIKLPIKIKDVRVEDNATADHLEITLTNTGKDLLNDFDIYFTVSDQIANKKDAYYEKLNGLSIKPGETKTIHFDNQAGEGHYFGNMNGLYGTSQNELVFDISLRNMNYQPMNFQVKKAKGTAEVAD